MEMILGTSTGGVQEEARKSIEKECSFLEDMQRENVIRHITSAVAPSCRLPILVMELMDCSLKKFILDCKPLDL